MSLTNSVNLHRSLKRLAAISALSLCACSLAACSVSKTPADAGVVAAGADPEVAYITPAAAKQAGIETAVTAPFDLREVVTLYGSIKPNAQRIQDLRPRFPGVVKSVTKQQGDIVRQGETLLTIESNESLRVYAIAAPLGGTVLERLSNPGETVENSQVLLKIADLSSVWGEFSAFARDLGRVHAGLPVRIIGADGKVLGQTQISYVASSGDGISQSVLVRAVLDNSDHQWIPGQFVTGEVVISETTVPVSVKPAALQMLAGKTVIFVKHPKGFQAKTVSVGRRSSDAIEITSGLRAGESYVAENSYLVKAELTKGEAEED